MAHRKGVLVGVAILALCVAAGSTSMSMCQCSLTHSCVIGNVNGVQLSTNAMQCSLNQTDISDLLIVRYNDTVLRADAFGPFVNLTMLEIFHGSMAVIVPGAFAKVPNMLKIVIQHNKLVIVEDNTFAGLDELRLLSLAFNNLTSISAGAFAGLKNLSYLVLTGNSLTHLPAPLFEPTPKLMTIVMNHNELAYLPAPLFDPLSYISRLDLSYNQLQTFKFPKLNVTLLTVQNNSLTELALNDHVVYLKAEHNQISSLTGTGTNLTTLLLNDNAITDVTPLLGMKKLTKLSLNDNPLKPSTVFNGFDGLHQLMLSNTSIQLTEQTFANLSHLELLDLSYNGLTELDFHLFSSLIDLEILIVAFNKIETINFIELRENLPNLHVLEICGNGWNSTYLKTVLTHMRRYHLSADMQGLSSFFLFSPMFVELCSTAPTPTPTSDEDDSLYSEDIIDKDFQEFYPTTPEPSTTEKILRTMLSTSKSVMPEASTPKSMLRKQAIALLETDADMGPAGDGAPVPPNPQPTSASSPLMMTFQVFVYLFAVFGVVSLAVLGYYMRQRRFDVRRISPMDIPDSVRLV
ncbi:insulin-like growth factor-binding protein complex acid labile subunit [Anopheles darlingi]|uniref:insulin-like growth factor-binding protein complex acid labile subunit n=1 Tax=Anopheles darlingi TaxID=43151 RepID=UPI0021005175|nr:insulin-like growth factor-binding protein complex acid labile subunit [Anopheles darlingi]